MERRLVQQKMLNLIDALSSSIVTTEALANEIMLAVAELSDQPGSRALQDTAIRQRVRALELRGELAALQRDYAAQFPFIV